MPFTHGWSKSLLQLEIILTTQKGVIVALVTQFFSNGFLDSLFRPSGCQLRFLRLFQIGMKQSSCRIDFIAPLGVDLEAVFA